MVTPKGLEGSAVVFGGASPEHDISILTGLQAARSLFDDGVDVVCLYWTKTGAWRKVPPTAEAADFLEPQVPGSTPVVFGIPDGFAEQRRRKRRPLEIRTVLNCCHGGPGEDGSLAAALMMAGIRVTGPRPAAAALAMDKLATALIAESIGVPAIETKLWSGAASVLPGRPWVVKPRFGGSSIDVEAGIEDTGTVDVLASRGVGRAGVLVQPFLDGWVDLNVALRTHPRLQCSPVERPLAGDAAILGYSEKYLAGSAGVGMESAARELPADIPESIRSRLVSSAKVMATEMGLTGAPRFDFLWDGAEELLMCEVNPIPGAWGNYLWREAGVAKSELFVDLLQEAATGVARPHPWVATSDGRALRVSNKIAAKLL